MKKLGIMLALAAASISGTVANPAQVMLPIEQRASAAIYNTERRRIAAGRGYMGMFSYGKGPGWTVAKVKRMAKKNRNRTKNKAAHKGK